MVSDNIVMIKFVLTLRRESSLGTINYTAISFCRSTSTNKKPCKILGNRKLNHLCAISPYGLWVQSQLFLRVQLYLPIGPLLPLRLKIFRMQQRKKHQ